MGKSNLCFFFIKYLLMTTDVASVLTGISLLWIGTYVRYHKNIHEFLERSTAIKVEDNIEFDHFYLEITDVVVFTSSFLNCIGVLGLIGIMKENRCLIFLNVFLRQTALVISTIICVVYSTPTDTHIKPSLKTSMQKYQTHPEITNSWDQIQQKFLCCGVDSYKDWREFMEGKYEVPISCCQDLEGQNNTTIENCRTNPDDPLFQDRLDGCFVTMEQSIIRNLDVIGSIIIALQIVILMMLYLLAITLPKEITTQEA